MGGPKVAATGPLSALPVPPGDGCPGQRPPAPPRAPLAPLPPPSPGPGAAPGANGRVRAAAALTVLPARGAPATGTFGWGADEASGRARTAPAPASSARNATVMAAGTVLSRVSGFARFLAIGWVFGQTRLADAYNQANTIPNTIYELLLGGVLSATLLPVLMRSLARTNAAEDDDAVPAVLSFITVVLVAGTAVFWLAAPALVHLYLLLAPGHRGAAERALATTWLRLFTPQLLFIGLIAVITALLNARRRFGAVAFSPVLANVVTIVALVAADRLVPHGSVGAYRRDAAAVAVVGIGTTAGYLAQLLAQLPALRRASVPLRLRWDPKHPALRTIGRLSGWTVGAVVANQLSFWTVSLLANQRPGNFSAFSYAYAFMLLPYAVAGVSIAYAVAPDLAQLWSRGDGARFAERVNRALRMTAFLMLPAGVGYALVARPGVVLVLAHGHEGVSSAALTGSVLVLFALGLPGYSIYLLLMRAFQSKQDTRSMFWLYVLENSVTVAAAVALYPVLGVRGLALAWIGAYTAALPLAWRKLKASAPVRTAINWWAKLAVATVAMGVLVAAVLQLLPGPGSLEWRAGRILAAVVVGALTFVLTARALGIEEADCITNPRQLFAR
ncbi:MAG: murein biosynthesis integral membrane protein MurJ [Acidimicrobiales bacterium]